MHTPHTIILLSALLLLSGCHSDHQTEISSQTAAPSVSDKIISEETEPLETENLIKHRLGIPNYVQETGYYCVPACMQMVLEYHGISVSQDVLAEDLNTSDTAGTEYLDLARVANKYIFNNEDEDPDGVGYHVQTIACDDSSQSIYDTMEKRIREDISTNDPVFIAIDMQTVYPEFDWTANHMVVCTGYAVYEDTDEIAYYYIVDPSYQVQDGEYGGLKTVERDTLYKAIYSNEEPAYIW